MEAYDAHRGFQIGPEQLLWISPEQHARTLSKSLSYQYHARQYLIQTAGAAYHLHGARITVCDDGPPPPVVLHATVCPRVQITWSTRLIA